MSSLKYYNLNSTVFDLGVFLNNFYLISDLKNIKKYLPSKITKYLFIANWSLSETPIKFRKEFFDIIKKINTLSFFNNNYNINAQIKKAALSPEVVITPLIV